MVRIWFRDGVTAGDGTAVHPDGQRVAEERDSYVVLGSAGSEIGRVPKAVVLFMEVGTGNGCCLSPECGAVRGGDGRAPDAPRPPLAGAKGCPDGEFDCYADAADDEPIFVLRAKDALAPAVVKYWLALRELHRPAKGDEREVRKQVHADDICRAMAEWRAGQPDLKHYPGEGDAMRLAEAVHVMATAVQGARD